MAEVNTSLFYEELNGNGNPDKLLEIARKGIFLYEPLFKNEKIKDHENTIEISILARQFFMINTDRQYEKFMDIISRKEEYPLFPFDSKNGTLENYFFLLIENEFFIKKLLKEKDKQRLLLAHNIGHNNLMDNLRKYHCLREEVFYLFLEIESDTKLDIISYFYFNDTSALEPDYFMNSNSCINIVMDYGRDFNIFKFCVEKIQSLESLFPNEGSVCRIPPFFPLNQLEKYSNAMIEPNKLKYVHEDKCCERFFNSVFTDRMCECPERIDEFFNTYDYVLSLYNIDKTNYKNFTIGNIHKSSMTIALSEEDIINHNGEEEDERINGIEEEREIESDGESDTTIVVSNRVHLDDYYDSDVDDEDNEYLRLPVYPILYNVNNIKQILDDPDTVFSFILPGMVEENYALLQIVYAVALIHQGFSELVIDALVHCITYGDIEYINNKIVFIILDNPSIPHNHSYYTYRALSRLPNDTFTNYLTTRVIN